MVYLIFLLTAGNTIDNKKFPAIIYGITYPLSVFQTMPTNTNNVIVIASKNRLLILLLEHGFDQKWGEEHWRPVC